MAYRTINDVNFAFKKVVIRLDLNVPIKNGAILDVTRIERILPTLQAIIKNNPKQLVILAHLGRPKKTIDNSLSLQPVAEALSKLLNKQVMFEATPIGKPLFEKLELLPTNSIVMLENIRFYQEEENNDSKFSELLSKLGDVFVNEAFSCSHREHASVAGITQYLPSYAGLELNSEIKALENILSIPQKPVLAIVAGSKVSSKIDLLTNLLNKFDYLFIGGGMANNILKAQGYQLGKSLIEHDSLAIALQILEQAKQSKCKLLLPIDAVVANNLETNASAHNVDINNIEDDQAIYDIGVKTVEMITATLDNCRTVLWNGPVGVYEIPPFDSASIAIAKKIAQITQENKIKSIAGGGDTVAVINKAKICNDFSYVSTAGGAFLEWLEGKELPGITCLKNCNN